MVKTNVVRTPKKKKHKKFKRKGGSNITSPKPKLPSPPDHFVALDEVPACVSSPEDECFTHTQAVIHRAIERRQDCAIKALSTTKTSSRSDADAVAANTSRAPVRFLQPVHVPTSMTHAVTDTNFAA